MAKGRVSNSRGEFAVGLGLPLEQLDKKSHVPPLSLDERLYRAGQHVLRSRLFFDLWFYFEGAETRPHIFETMCNYNDFFGSRPTPIR